MTSRWLPAALLAVALALAGCDDASPGAERSPSPAAPADPTVVTCPEAPAIGSIPSDRPDPDLPDHVPAGATSVRLCPGGDKYTAVLSPYDALTTHVSALVRAVNRQPSVDRPRCVRQWVPTYRMAFGYPDGSRFLVSGSMSSCYRLVAGSGWRTDSSPPLRTFVHRLLDQRATADPPGPDRRAAQLSCGEQHQYGYTWPLGRATDLAVAVLCFGEPNHPRRARRAAIPAKDLAVLLDSMRTDTFSVAGLLGCPPGPRREYWLVGESAWRDPIAVTDHCEALAVGGSREWEPRGRARRIVERLVSAARPVP
ncbi:hypothetical protein [Nocardioides sp. MH1]|uniref:hypothetical protein n=1 Tax=Nocardioides sp. MH1 TaxID=3242490 RepID=UPI0035229BC5